MTPKTFETARDEMANKRFDESDLGDGQSCHYGFKTGADWARAYHLEEIKRLNRRIIEVNGFLHSANSDRASLGLDYKKLQQKLDATLMREEKLIEVLGFYANGGNFNHDIWIHDELGHFTGKWAREVLAQNKALREGEK